MNLLGGSYEHVFVCPLPFGDLGVQLSCGTYEALQERLALRAARVQLPGRVALLGELPLAPRQLDRGCEAPRHGAPQLLRQAARAGVRPENVPLPHELAMRERK